MEHCQKEYVAFKQNSFDLHFYLENIVENLNTLYYLFGRVLKRLKYLGQVFFRPQKGISLNWNMMKWNKTKME